MGMDADVIAIGPFSQDIIDMLDYPAEYYDKTKPGATVITTVFSATSTDLSYQLARAMGVDAWDFNTHKIDPKNVDMEDLEEFVDCAVEHGMEDITTFIKLVGKGFTFFYRPNG
jgi:hypothetical protein